MEISQKITSSKSLDDSQKIGAWREQIERWHDDDFEFTNKLIKDSDSQTGQYINIASKLRRTAVLFTITELRGSAPSESRISRVFSEKCEEVAFTVD